MDNTSPRQPPEPLSFPIDKVWPDLIYSRVHIATSAPSIVISIGAPQTDTTAGARNRRSGPFNVISRPSVPTGLPANMFATANNIVSR